MAKANLFYAQSGGVTSVINASACGVIETARKHRDKIGKVYAGHNGIVGALNENLIDTNKESARTIAALRSTPAGAFGSCRYKLKSYEENQREYERLMEVFRAHNIRYFLYNGGGDSQDTAHKVSQLSHKKDFPITCIGIPKYVAVSIREAGLDVASMCDSSTKIFVMEVMGRHAGWIAGAAGLATEQEGDAPHVILFPEIAFNKEKFLKKVQTCVRKYGYCAIVVSEGAQNADGTFLADTGGKDAFGHMQLGGVAPFVANMIKDALGYKYHWAVADYLQRSARHIASSTDVEQAYALGQAAVEFALAGKDAVMPAIVRKPTKKYSWKIGEARLADVANVEKMMPRSYISRDGFHITDYPLYKNGLPQYARLKRVLEQKKLKRWRAA